MEQIINTETPTTPLTDEQIAELLAKQPETFVTTDDEDEADELIVH